MHLQIVCPNSKGQERLLYHPRVRLRSPVRNAGSYSRRRDLATTCGFVRGSLLLVIDVIFHSLKSANYLSTKKFVFLAQPVSLLHVAQPVSLLHVAQPVSLSPVSLSVFHVRCAKKPMLLTLHISAILA